MILVPPALSERDKVYYVAQTKTVTMDTIGKAIAEGIGFVEERLIKQGIVPSGPPLIRYRVIDMARALEIEVGWCVEKPAVVDGDFVSDELPAGTYATLTFCDPREGVAGNGALIRWAHENGIEFEQWESAEGDRFLSRVEFELSDPEKEPDQSKWRTEVAILIKKKSPLRT